MDNLALQLEIRGEGSVVISHSDELRCFLELSRHDPEAWARLEGDSGDLGPLLPFGGIAASADPEWLRAAELLDEAPACPGERILAQSLIATTQWWRAGEISTAARALAGAVAGGAPLPATIPADAVLRGCAAVVAAAAILPAARQARLA